MISVLVLLSKEKGMDIIMKKIGYLMVIMMLFCTACSGEEKQINHTDQNNTSEAATEPLQTPAEKSYIPETPPLSVAGSTKTYEPVRLNFSLDENLSTEKQILCLDGEKLYYYICVGDEEHPELDNGHMDFYEYDMKTTTNTYIGRIQNWETWSNSFAYLDNKFYMSMELSDTEGKFSVTEYCIDPAEKKVVVLNKEEIGRLEDSRLVKTNPLVTSIAVDERYYIRQEIERVGEEIDRSIITLCDTENFEENKVIISKELTVASGCVIEDIAIYEGLIYTYEWEIGNGSKEERRYIRTYVMDGNMTSEARIDSDIENYLWSASETYDSIYDFYVMGDYVFLDTWSGYELVVKKEKDEYHIVPDYGKLEVQTLDNTEGSRTKESPNILFDNRNEREFYRFDSESNNLEHMVIETSSPKCKGTVCGSWLLVETESGDFYKVDLTQ